MRHLGTHTHTHNLSSRAAYPWSGLHLSHTMLSSAFPRSGVALPPVRMIIRTKLAGLALISVKLMLVTARFSLLVIVTAELFQPNHYAYASCDFVIIKDQNHLPQLLVGGGFWRWRSRRCRSYNYRLFSVTSLLFNAHCATPPVLSGKWRGNIYLCQISSPPIARWSPLVNGFSRSQSR